MKSIVFVMLVAATSSAVVRGFARADDPQSYDHQHPDESSTTTANIDVLHRSGVASQLVDGNGMARSMFSVFDGRMLTYGSSGCRNRCDQTVPFRLELFQQSLPDGRLCMDCASRNSGGCRVGSSLSLKRCSSRNCEFRFGYNTQQFKTENTNENGGLCMNQERDGRIRLRRCNTSKSSQRFDPQHMRNRYGYVDYEKAILFREGSSSLFDRRFISCEENKANEKAELFRDYEKPFEESRWIPRL